jgi:uncharacterized repeat protein (TIGR01451 family)
VLPPLLAAILAAPGALPAQPAFDDASKEVLDLQGRPVAGAMPGRDLVYRITWCNTGTAPGTNVRLLDFLPDCVLYLGPTTLDGAPVTPDPYDPGPPQSVLLIADRSQDAGECHPVEIKVQVLDDPAMCAVGLQVENLATISSDEGVSRNTDGGIPTVFTIGSVGQPAFDDAAMTATDPMGGPVSGQIGTQVLYTVTWCNTGGATATNVEFRNTLPSCIQYVGPTLLDGGEVIPDPFDPGPPATVQFITDRTQNPDDCHSVEFTAVIRDDPGPCPEGSTVTNNATISCDEGVSQQTSDADFPIGPPPPPLRRNAEVQSLDPLDPPKGPTGWGTVMDRVGACDPAAPRLDAGNDVVPTPPSFPPAWCAEGDGVWTGQGTPLIFYEAATDCGLVLSVTKQECGGDTRPDLMVTYR